MADAIVSLGVQKLWELLSKEYELLGGVEDQVIELRSDLNMLMSFLKDADAKKQTSALVRHCLEEIKEITFDAEDIIEAFQLKEEGGILKRFTCVTVDRRRMALDITSISKRIGKVIHVMQTFGVKPIINDNGYVETQRETHHTLASEHENYHDHVGLEENVEKLVCDLVDKDSVQVVSITGMGGIGKTTLARHVFNHGKVREHFRGFAWVCVSQQFTPKYVWGTILKTLSSEYDEDEVSKMSGGRLQDKLFKLLEASKFLIVLDDMWKEEDWDKLKDAFPEKGWKILLTSRNKDVGLHINTTCVTFKPKCLTPEESWMLFQRVAFPINDTTVDAEKEAMGKKMVECCGGLPLAIKVLGGLLAAQNTHREWKRVCDNIKTNILGRTTFREDRNSLVEHVLSLSFEELPRYLKHCFLYLAHFPEDSAIDVDKLSYYLAAEGIPTPRGYDGTTIRDVADCYIKELAKRNMVITEKDITTSRYETCQLHDTMRELCLLKAKEENFLRIVNAKTCSSTTYSKSRRFVVHWSETFTGAREISNPKLRSLVFVQEVKLPCLMESDLSSTRLLYLRVLDLSRALLKGRKLPSNIGKLIHLRYLSLYKAGVTHLPSWLRYLKLLLYLNLDVTLITLTSGTNRKEELLPIYVPNIFKEMQELRYLSLPRYIQGKAKLELGKLVNLETLENFQTKNSNEKDLLGMTKLRNLSVYVHKGCSLKTLSSTLGSLEQLETLTIDDYWVTRDPHQMECSEEFVLDFAHLYQLNLSIYVPRFLDREEPFPSRLTSITLNNCCLEKDPIQILEKLRHLNEVSLGAQAFAGKKMVCSRGGFPQLQKLLLTELKELEEWIIEEHSMPLLHSLIIQRCEKLKELPDGLRFITSLKELRLSVTNNDFEEKLKRQGKDYHKIQHIPNFQISVVETMNVHNNRQPGENLLKRMYSQICGPRSERAFHAR